MNQNNNFMQKVGEENSSFVRQNPHCGLESVDPEQNLSFSPTNKYNINSINKNLQLQKARRILYLSHVFAQLTDVSWQFCIILFLSAYTQYESLFFVSTYGVFSGCMILVFNASLFGNFIDSKDYSRIFIARVFLRVQWFSVLCTTVLGSFLFARYHPDPASSSTLTSSSIQLQFIATKDILSILFLVGVHLFGGLAKSIDKGFTVAIEKDWIVVMSRQLDMEDSMDSRESEILPKKEDHKQDKHENGVRDPLQAQVLETETHQRTRQNKQEDLMTHSISSDFRTTAPSIVLSTRLDPYHYSHRLEQHQQHHETLMRQQKSWLTETNVIMKQIDLSCKMIGPTVAGYFLACFQQVSHRSCENKTSWSSSFDRQDDWIRRTQEQSTTSSTNHLTTCEMHQFSYAVLMIGTIHLSSLLFEYFATHWIYSLVPPLSVREDMISIRSASTSSMNTQSIQQEGEDVEEQEDGEGEENDECVKNKSRLLASSWITTLITSTSSIVSIPNHRNYTKIASVDENEPSCTVERDDESTLPAQNLQKHGIRTSTMKRPNALSSCGSSLQSSSTVCQLGHNFVLYMKQPICFAGIALSLLYINVLSFGNLMTAYLMATGMSLDSIGLWRGISSTIGLVGTIVYQYSIRKIGLPWTGMWSVTFQFVFLSVSYASFFWNDTDPRKEDADNASSHQRTVVSLSMLIVGVCASRIGLYVFDITVNQLIQLLTKDDVRGVVGGFQESLNAFFDILSYLFGICFPDPKDFYKVVTIGYVCMGFATIIYAIGLYARREQYSVL